MATLDELTTPATRAEVEEAIYATLAARGAKTTTWKPGAVVRTIITGIAIVLAALSELQAKIAKGGFLELATGDWLTLVARYVYDVERSTGTFATSTVTVQNTGGGVYSGDADDLVLSVSAGTAAGKTYRNTAAFSIPALAAAVEIPVQAVEIGSGSSAAANAIDTLETALLGVVVTASTAATGQDEETDAELRTRCRAKTGTLSPNGPRDAYSYVARSAKLNDVSVGVTRVKTIADGNGNVDVYVATASGTLAGTAGDPTTALGAVADAIHKNAEPLAVTPTVQNATPLSQGVTYELWVRDTIALTTSEIETAVADALAAYAAEHPIGGVELPSAPTGRIYTDALRVVIAGAVEGHFLDLSLTVPAADVDLTASQFFQLGTVSATAIHLVSGGAD